jgi:hypothetical protein
VVCARAPAGPVPVTVTVYVPAEVPAWPVPPPPPEEEPPHADRKIKPENSTQPKKNPRNFFLRDEMPVPSKASPPIGNNIAKKMPRDCGDTEAVVAAVVLTVNVDGPAPPVTAAGLNAQVAGWLAAAGVMAQVRFTVLVNPATAAIVIVEVDDAPAAIVAGVRAVPVIVKSGTTAAVTVRLSGVV